MKLVAMAIRESVKSVRSQTNRKDKENTESKEFVFRNFNTDINFDKLLRE